VGGGLDRQHVLFSYQPLKISVAAAIMGCREAASSFVATPRRSVAGLASLRHVTFRYPPKSSRDLRTDWTYIFGALPPKTRDGAGHLRPLPCDARSRARKVVESQSV
jgi:hypothetical protein